MKNFDLRQQNICKKFKKIVQLLHPKGKGHTVSVQMVDQQMHKQTPISQSWTVKTQCGQSFSEVALKFLCFCEFTRYFLDISSLIIWKGYWIYYEMAKIQKFKCEYIIIQAQLCKTM